MGHYHVRGVFGPGSGEYIDNAFSSVSAARSHLSGLAGGLRIGNKVTGSVAKGSIVVHDKSGDTYHVSIVPCHGVHCKVY